MKSNFGILFKNALDRSGYTQKQAAKLLKVTPQTVNSYIQGRSIPNIEIFERMINYFGPDLFDVFEISLFTTDILKDEVIEYADTLTYSQNILIKTTIALFQKMNSQDSLKLEEK